jgi:hypothetical protein
VTVAAADLSGDFRAEIITGSGFGAQPHVKAFRTDGSEVASFFAYDAAFLGGVYVAAANGVIVTGAGAGAGPHVKLFTGFHPWEQRTELASFFAFDPGFTGGVRVGAGAAGAFGAVVVNPSIRLIPGPGGPPLLRVFELSGLTTRFDAWAFDPAFPGGAFVD